MTEDREPGDQATSGMGDPLLIEESLLPDPAVAKYPSTGDKVDMGHTELSLLLYFALAAIDDALDEDTPEARELLKKRISALRARSGAHFDRYTKSK
jgi:hypothetical protein